MMRGVGFLAGTIYAVHPLAPAAWLPWLRDGWTAAAAVYLALALIAALATLRRGLQPVELGVVLPERVAHTVQSPCDSELLGVQLRDVRADPRR